MGVAAFKINYMKAINETDVLFDDYVERIACENLTDEEFEMEYQGLFINDKVRLLAKKGINLIPIAALNQVFV